MKAPASANEVNRILGDVDPLVVERILATGASAEEISEALSEIEDEHGFGEQAHRSSSPCVAEVRALLDELDVLDDEAASDDDARM